MTAVLTDDEITHLWDTRVGDPTECMPLVDSDKTAFARAIEQAILQSPEVQAWKKDAERYRHLRDNGDLSPRDLFNAWWLSDHGNPQTLDAAIDAAMEEQP